MGLRTTDGPHILFYGHYDVQPVDPVSLWHSDPFDPQYVDGPRGKRFVARGAVDDKGQTVMFLAALRAWHEAGGGILARITVLIEGEEEVGSVNWAVPGGQQGRAEVGFGADQRYGDVGCGNPRDHHSAARHVVCGTDRDLRRKRRSALRACLAVRPGIPSTC